MITIIGGSNIDLYGHHGHDAPSHHDDSVPGKVSCHAGGVGRNIAENLGRMKCQPRMVSVLGGDAYADMIMDSLNDAGVDTRHVIRHDDVPSDTYMAIYHQDGRLITAVNDMTLIESLTPEEIIPALSSMTKEDMIIMDGNPDDAVIEAVFAECGECMIGFDGVSTHKVTKINPYLAKLGLLKCNRQEAAVLTGLPVEALDYDHAKALREHGVDTVVISDGADGFLIGNGDGYDRFESAPVAGVVNVSGAGDALMAGVIYGLSQGMDMPTMGAFAARLAGLTLSCDGPVHPEPLPVIESEA